MFTRGVYVVYLLSTLTVWLKLNQSTLIGDNYIGNALLFGFFGAVIAQEKYRIRKYSAVSRVPASCGIIDGVVLVPLLLASLCPLVLSKSSNAGAFIDMFWISLLNNSHMIITGIARFTSGSQDDPNSRIFKLLLDVITMFAVNNISGVPIVVLVLAMIYYQTFHHLLLFKIQNTFTLGEASILSNAITLLSYTIWLLTRNIYYSTPSSTPHDSVMSIALILGSVMIVVVVLAVMEPVAQADGRIDQRPHGSAWRAFLFYGSALFIIFGIIAPWASHIIGSHPVPWTYQYVFADTKNMAMVTYWLFCLIILLPAIWYIQAHGVRGIIIRKCFHLLGLIMFVPATIITPRFLSLGYAVAFAALLIIEAIKYLTIPPCGAWLTQFMGRFLDSRDAGHFTVTHIYLLLGCAIPLWLLSAIGLDDSCLASFLPSYAGLLTLGIGDSAAAVIGTYYGRHKWPWPSGSSRSLQGSIASVVAVVVSVMPMSFYIRLKWLDILIAVVLSTLLEALTDQIDNIILPLLFSSLLATVY